MSEPVVVFRTWSDIEASIVRGLLEAHGVEVNMASDVPHAVFPLTVNGLGEVRIAVASDVAELEREGFAATYLDVRPEGLLDLAAFESALRPDTIVASVMAVNNEIGVVQDIAAIGEICRARGIVLHVDAAQADRVETTALAFLAQVRGAWKLEEPLAEPVLRWAARLHEVGLDIAHSHHRHGAYLLQNEDLPGLPREEQRLLAAVVGNHRRKLNLVQVEELVPPWHARAEFLVVLLRLAVLLHRGRGPRALPEIGLHARGRSLEVEFPKGWLAEHPLTAADLEQEAGYLQAAGFKLRVS